MVGKTVKIIRLGILIMLTLAAVGTGMTCIYSSRFPILHVFGPHPEYELGRGLPSRRWVELSAARPVSQEVGRDRWYVQRGRFAFRYNSLVAKGRGAGPSETQFGGFHLNLVRYSPAVRRPRMVEHNYVYTQPEYEAALARWTDLKKTEVLVFDVGFPLWAPLVVFAAYPTIAFIRGPLRRWRRRRKGLCLKCAYDLTGNMSGVCPECGVEV